MYYYTIYNTIICIGVQHDQLTALLLQQYSILQKMKQIWYACNLRLIFVLQ